MTILDAADGETFELVKILDTADVDQLRFGWWSRTDPGQVRRLLSQAPGLSVWVPDAYEYLLVSSWRNRNDVVHVHELVAVRYPTELITVAIKQALAAGVRLFMTIEMSERRPNAFYRRAGLSLLETVQSYELVAPRRDLKGARGLDIRLVDELSPDVLASLVAVDWEAFPWLWRNSEEEFRDYFGQTGVEIYVLCDQGEAIGYLGITVFPGWGHIDRLAIHPSKQGMGFGRGLTEFAIGRLMALGAVRVGLSTQQRNRRSQALYTRLGFRRQVTSDYRIFGRVLWQNDSIDELVMGDQG